MALILERSGIHLKHAQLDQLWRYHSLLRKRNQDRDLTRLIGFESIVIKHYVDCMIVGNWIPLPSPLLDIGSGAGFPGIPLKIRYPHLDIILAEPRPRRIEFLKEALATLGLARIEVFEHKVVSRSFQQPVKGVVTRALEEIEKTFLRTSACLDKGGLLIFMKGPSVDDEVREARRRFGGQFELILDKSYCLPATPYQRRLIVFSKLADRQLP